MSKKGPTIPELAPLIKWLADVESVVTGKSVLTYRDPTSGIQYVCAVCIDKQIVGRLFEHDGELWVLGRDGGCDTGQALRLCSVSRLER